MGHHENLRRDFEMGMAIGRACSFSESQPLELTLHHLRGPKVMIVLVPSPNQVEPSRDVACRCEKMEQGESARDLRAI